MNTEQVKGLLFDLKTLLMSSEYSKAIDLVNKYINVCEHTVEPNETISKIETFSNGDKVVRLTIEPGKAVVEIV